MSYRLGVDVGGAFTDLLLVNEATGATWSAKVPSTPADQSVGVLNGITRVCERAVTTVANSYVRPRVSRYVHNLREKLEQTTESVKLHILRSDGGLASAASSEELP